MSRWGVAVLCTSDKCVCHMMVAVRHAVTQGYDIHTLVLFFHVEHKDMHCVSASLTPGTLTPNQVGITALVVTKLDGTARGGFVVSIVSDLGVPVKLIGVGESLYDLRDFEPVLFVDSLLGYSVSLRVRYSFG